MSDTSGPAFPINANESADRCIYTGMTLRDYFAAKASDEDIAVIMAGMPDTERIFKGPDGGKQIIRSRPENARQIARYMHADAMLKERAK
jgi:hypothetical protein